MLPMWQLKVKVTVKGQILNIKYWTLCRVHSITPLLMEGFSSNLNDTFTSTRGCAEPMFSMCQLNVKVTVKGQILNKQILDIMFFLLCKSYTNGKKSWLSCPCVRSRSRSQLKVNYQLKVKVTIKEKSLILAQLPMCQFKVKVTIEGQLSAQGQCHN